MNALSIKGCKGFQVKHGSWGSKLHHVWKAMNQRCHNPNNKDFKHYGARGIFVCESWRSSFQNFLDDMGDRPAGMELDRIDNDGPYSPENCRWATRSQQMRNIRRPLIELNGESKSFPDWCRVFGTNRECVRQRVRNGWDLIDALTRPVRLTKRAA